MWYNPIMRWMLRSPLHPLVSKNMMLMTYTGRKSGKSYTTPMNYLEVNGALFTSSYRERKWWRNLRGGAEVSLHLKGEEVAARAETIEDQAEVADSLGQYFQAAPQLAKYMEVRIGVDGQPNEGDIARLADEMVMVRSELQ